MRSGLDQKNIGELINHEAFFDTTDIKKQLGYKGGDLDKAFEETINDCPKTMLVGNLQRSVDWLNESTVKTLKQLKGQGAHRGVAALCAREVGRQGPTTTPRRGCCSRPTFA